MAKKFGKIRVSTAGVTFDGRQGKLMYARRYANSIYLTLRREPNNTEDPNAVAILCHIPPCNLTFKAGYIPRPKALWISKVIDSGRIIRTSHPAIVGGYGEKSLGLHFDLCYELPESATAPAQVASAQ